jgi:hypothetical protein
MARTTRDIVDYFPHDARASSSDTLIILQERFGNDGYAFWFKLLEKLCRSEGFFIDCRNPVKQELLFAHCHITPEKGITIVETLADLDAIDKTLWENHVVWCQHLVDNLAEVYKNRRREKPQKPVITGSKPITTGDNDNPSCSTPVEIPQSKVKKSKEKESKEKNIAFFEKFWELYPKKTTKKETLDYCTKMQLDGDLDTRILLALEKQSKAKAMIRESGQFTPDFPDPIRWLKKERWEDEIQTGGNNGKQPISGNQRASEPRPGSSGYQYTE